MPDASTTNNLFLHRIPPATRRTFLFCVKLPLFSENSWYLAGGTALALQVGHRKSVDLDFFTPNSDFDAKELERELIKTKKWNTSFERKGTLYGEFHQTKMSFIAYPFFIPSKKKLPYGTVKILLPSDIASMKIVAISQRGRKRDFTDLYWYCQNREPLDQVVDRAITQFPGQKNNVPHILKSLTYFSDAESDPMPNIFFKASWSGIKKFFQSEIRIITKKFLKLK